jgi:hypothetical protein
MIDCDESTPSGVETMDELFLAAYEYGIGVRIREPREGRLVRCTKTASKRKPLGRQRKPKSKAA